MDTPKAHLLFQHIFFKFSCKNGLPQNVFVHVDKALTLPPPAQCGQMWFIGNPPPPLLSKWFMDAAEGCMDNVTVYPGGSATFNCQVQSQTHY